MATYTTLISAADLSAHLDDPHWVVVDCRHDLMNLSAGRDGYAIGHIPQALFVDLETQLSGAKRGEDGVFGRDAAQMGAASRTRARGAFRPDDGRARADQGTGA